MKEKVINAIVISGIVTGFLIIAISFFLSNIAFFIGGTFVTLTSLYLYIFYCMFTGKKKMVQRKVVSIGMGIIYLGLVIFVAIQVTTASTSKIPMEDPIQENPVAAFSDVG